MGSIGDCYDNSLAESLFATLQLELLDECRWETRRHPALAVLEWIEDWYNPSRRHSSMGDSARLTSKPPTSPPPLRHDHGASVPSRLPQRWDSTRAPAEHGPLRLS